MNVAKDSTVDFGSKTPFTIRLVWDSTVDFDLLAVYETEARQKGVVYFAESGSSEDFPFLRLHDDVDLSSLEMDKEQRITVERFALKKLWIFAWSFDHLEKQSSLDFGANAVELFVESEETSIQTTVSGTGKGNICLLGEIALSASGELCFTNHSRVSAVKELTEIEELYQFL